MPIFSYQSFNANTAKMHDLASLTAQNLTVDTHNHWAKSTRPTALIYPTLHDEDFEEEGNPGKLPANRHRLPVEGPANLVGTEPPDSLSKTSVSTAGFYEMMKQKVLQNRQGVFREMRKMPHVTAFGELDGAHSDFADMNEFVVGRMTGASTNKQACQNFSVYCSTGFNVECVGSGEGWYAIRYLGYVVVFVHVPNRLMKSAAKKPAKQGPIKGVAAQHQVKPAPAKPYGKPVASSSSTTRDGLVKFYKNICDTILKNGGGVIDVVMGDTNQSSGGVTPDVVGEATSMPFQNAHGGDAINPVDGYDVSVGGTNSTGTRMYDVAVYNTATVKMKKICYWSQLAPIGDGSTVAAVTDHMGLAIEVE
jgi:hypothetical protein